MPQIFLFIGENSFLLRQEKQRWIANFAQKHGEENLARLEARNLTMCSLLDEVTIAPFIAKKRLVLLDGIPSCTKEEIGILQKDMHPDVVLLLSEPKPDKRLGAVKELLKVAEVKEFAPLTGAKLQHWMREFVTASGGKIAPDACSLLLEMVGEDQDALVQELTKLLLFSKDKNIQRADVPKLVVCSGEQVVWRLMDLLGAGQREEALLYAHSLLERGESPYGLWSRLLWMVSTLLLVASAVEDGQRSPAAVTKSVGVNFGSARSFLPLAQRLDRRALQRIIDQTAAADIDLKTGAFRATDQEPQELMALIDRCILSFG